MGGTCSEDGDILYINEFLVGKSGDAEKTFWKI
jgi:hypothetical protein